MAIKITFSNKISNVIKKLLLVNSKVIEMININFY